MERSGRPTRREFLGTTAALAAPSIPAWAHVRGEDRIRLGLIGCGGRGMGAVQNALAADPGAVLSALGDLFEDRCKAARKALQAKDAARATIPDDACHWGFDNARRVIEASDVVLIACAAKFHPRYSRLALEAGKHVFVEKPHAIDPAGLQECRNAARIARERKLCLVSGLQSRHDNGFQETVARVHDGAIGEILAIEENFLRAPYGLVRRKPGMAETAYQFSNQYHFSWLSGDDVPQSLVHNIDRATWVMKGVVPEKVHGMGGRASSPGEMMGDVFDHHALVYQYATGTRLYAFCRTITGCYDENSSIILGSEGRCHLRACRIEGRRPWAFEGRRNNPYVEEHRALLGAVRGGKALNDGEHMVLSTQATVMGQLSCYSGREVTRAEVERSEFVLGPSVDQCSFEMEPPVRPEASGGYPVPRPGDWKGFP